MAWAALGTSAAAAVHIPFWIDLDGTRARPALLLPLILSTIVLISVRYGWRIPAVAGATLMALFSLVTGFSIGLFFLPTCFLLVMAAAFMPPPRTTMA